MTQRHQGCTGEEEEEEDRERGTGDEAHCMARQHPAPCQSNKHTYLQPTPRCDTTTLSDPVEDADL
jgi:hypothetical protein